MTPQVKDQPTIKREATSIKIKPEVWKQAKIEAIRGDMELSELVEQAIEAWLANNERREKSKK
jgi:hypothetical protein